MATFSEVIKRLMEDKGLKQKDLAEFLGVSKQVISNWFTRGYKPELEQIPRIAELFGISTDVFFQMLNGEVVGEGLKVNETDTLVPVSEAYQLQKKISDLQEQLIKYQAKELEEKSRQIENQKSLSPNKDIV